ncbi:MAG: MGMT family protein [Dehalococcoidia bacterium]|nr:MGMT family protein [Dehalococcoidia bacterium]
MAVARHGAKVSLVVLPRSSESAAVAAVHRSFADSYDEMRETSAAAFGTLPERLVRHMSGEQVAFDDEVDKSMWTAFQARIWEATRLIPYGTTRSYGWVAATAGQPKASRAAGQALHRNPVPIIVPCHRVVGADSSLTGFRSGIEMKQRLLSLEGVPPIHHAIV